MTSGLKPGLTGETSFVVGENHLASAVGSGLVNVFSTAMMIAGMEEAAVKCVQPFLDKGMTTVGVHVDITHKAAT
ncbi:MAG: thioesterase, partial [Desulfovibrio sp.]|nr:thioesterase [Desulfovibrio sp.]